jgi:glycosyltransferase involved in cell wall biosynthesis
MKFSVLLPTRNRLEYLRYAVETVRRQDYADWEIVISDNDSEDDIAGYVASLDDSRIRYLRTDRLIPVTDNWNNALSHSDGDYVVMLGDDDGLLPGYFSGLLAAFDTHPDADFVYVSAYFFAYRGAMQDEPEGFLRRDRNPHFGSAASPYWLERGTAERIARGYLDFRMPVASNMQFSLISRRMIERLNADGPFFRSPFPDFYATPLLFLRAERILICPQPMVVIGITPKSYGAFHFTNRAAQGVTFLVNADQLAAQSPVRRYMLPGTSYYDSWLLAMHALEHASGGRELPNYRRYRFLQIVHGYKARYFDRKSDAAELRSLRAAMTLGERILYGLALPVGFGVLRALPAVGRQRLVAALRRAIGQHTIHRKTAAQDSYDTLLDVYDALDLPVSVDPRTHSTGRRASVPRTGRSA